MSMIDKWWDAANALDREKIANLLEDRFVMVRHQTGEEFNKEQSLHYIVPGIREQVTVKNRCLIYENEDIVVSHSILDSPVGYIALMLVLLVKYGKFTRQEKGMMPLPAEKFYM